MLRSGQKMGSEQEQNRHNEAALRAAVQRKQKALSLEVELDHAKELAKELARYKRNLQVTLQVVNPQPCDFPGCVE